MKLFKRRVESIEFKRVMKRFYQRKVKPAVLSTKHFFKSSHRYFKNHPRLRTASIVGGIFVLFIVVSVIANTFSKYLLSSNADGTTYTYVDEFWHKLSRDLDGDRKLKNYTRPNINSSFVAAGTECGDTPNCGMAGTGEEATPFLISNVNQFMYVRSLNFNESTGKYFKITNDLDFTGVVLDSVSFSAINEDNPNPLFGGFIDADYKHIKGIGLSLSGNASVNVNGLIPGIVGTAENPAGITNAILDDVNMVITGTYGDSINAAGALVGYMGAYSYVLNSGVYSGDVNVTNAVAGAIGDNIESNANRGLFVGSLVGIEDNNSNIFGSYSRANTLKNGIVNVYSYANFHVSGVNSNQKVRLGGVLGFRSNNSGSRYMNGSNSMFFIANYYGSLEQDDENCTKVSAANFQYVYNSLYALSSSESPHYSYYWFKGSRRDIPSNSSNQTFAIAKDADYLQSVGFAANLNSYDDVVRFYFNDGLGTTIGPKLAKYVTDAEWYISRDNYNGVRAYFPIVRKEIDTREQSSKTAGTVRVHFSGNGHNEPSNPNRTIRVTNQDEYLEDFVYRKIELPFADEVLSGTTYTTRVNGVTYTMTFNGWKLKKVSGTEGSYNTPGSIAGMNYDYTKRTDGSAYSKNINEVYSEGGYYLLPDGVDYLEFEAVWAYTVYLSDNTIQKAYAARTYNYMQRQSEGYGFFASGDGLTSNNPVTDIDDAYRILHDVNPGGDKNSNLIVLVHNYHRPFSTDNSNTISADWERDDYDVAVTIKSADNDGDHKPDYSLFVRNPTQMHFNRSIRFDFINLLQMPQVAGYGGTLGSFFLDKTGGTNSVSIDFEVSETVVTDHITLFTQEADVVKISGGYYDIYSSHNQHLQLTDKYMVFGGKARAGNLIATSLYDNNNEQKPEEYGRIINVVGGIINQFSYDVSPIRYYWGKIYTFVDGGYINNYYTLYLGEVQYKLDVTIKNSYINNCYGAGFADTSYVPDGLIIRVDNARIGNFYGGPQYGAMKNDLTINITNSALDNVYGGGYGGTEYFTTPSSRFINQGSGMSSSTAYNSGLYGVNNGKHTVYIQFYGENKSFKTVNYRSKRYFYNGVQYTAVEDILAYLSNSSVEKVTLNIDDSKVKENIYGGGNRGTVDGDILINLHNVEVGGSVFGAGKAGVQDTVKVNTSRSVQSPKFFNYALDTEYNEAGVDSNNRPYVRDFEWKNTSNTIYSIGIYENGNSGSVDSLNGEDNGVRAGLVKASNIYINISGDNTGNNKMIIDGDVFGGGDMAPVVLTNGNAKGNIHVNINDGVHIKGNVFGGGNAKDVDANTIVYVDNADANNKTTIDGGVYASGNGDPDEALEVKVEGSATVTITGNPDVGSVYGGGNSSSSPLTNVYVEGGHIGYLYGGSNQRGTIDESRIYVGKKSPTSKEKGYQDQYDFCGNRAFNMSLTNENSAYNDTLIHFKNLTDKTIDEFIIKIYIDPADLSTLNSLSARGSSGSNRWSYSGGVITVDRYDRWGTHATHILTPGSEITVGIMFANEGGPKTNFHISKVSISGFVGGQAFETDVCPYSNYTNNSGTRHIPDTAVRTTKMSNIKVDNIFGGNNKGGRTINTNVLVLSGDYYVNPKDDPQPTYYDAPYTVEVGNVFGGGNEAQTGPDVESWKPDKLRAADTYEHNRFNWAEFPNGKKYVPDNKARIVIYGAHVSGSVYGGGKGNDELSTEGTLSAMYSTPFVLITHGAQVDGSVFGGGFAKNAPVGMPSADGVVDKSKDPDVIFRRYFIKPFVFIDWGTVNGNVYGGGYGDVIHGGTITYATTVTLYEINNIAKRTYFQMEADDNYDDQRSSYREHEVTNFRNRLTDWERAHTEEHQVCNRWGCNGDGHWYLHYTDDNSPFKGLTMCNSSNPGYVHIKGSVFGGGERGEKEGGYDYKFESVIDGTTVYVEENKDYSPLTIDGDIFGSGNYSSSHGYSNVLIKDIGSADNPKVMKSIQRAGRVFINNSYIRLTGGTDVTNKFNKTKYVFSRVDDLRLGQNTTLYMGGQANLLQSISFYDEWTAMHDDGWTFEMGAAVTSITPAWGETVNEDGEIKQVVRDFSSGDEKICRLYLLNDKGLNLLREEEVNKKFGEVHGMAFFGVYSLDANGKIQTSYFDKKYDLGRTSASYMTKQNVNAYILGENSGDTNMDYRINGFVTNTITGTGRNAQAKTVIVNPTPQNQNYYYWTIGNPVIAQEVNLTASKYIRSGMKSVSLHNFDPDKYTKITFDIAGLDVSGLKTEANYINPSAVPTLAATDEDAMNSFGLSIETGDTGWVNEGFTYFQSDYNGGSRTSDIIGTMRYESGGSDIPKLIFNLENSRNLKEEVDLGYMIITINAHAFDKDDPITAINTTFKIRVNMDTFYYEDNEFESSMAPGRHYKSFLSTNTDITSNSEFSTYFNMYAYGVDLYHHYKEDFYKNNTDVSFDHVLYSTYRLPAGARITMLDISTNEPKYYYYDVTGTETLDTMSHLKVNGERTQVYIYPCSWFKAMDVTSDGDKYDEAINQRRYVINEGDTTSTIEQFIFMVDFKNVTQHTKPINDIKDEEFFLGIQTTADGEKTMQAYPMYETMKDMHYSLYDNSQVSFDLDLHDTPTQDETIYVDDTFTFDANVTVRDQKIQTEDGTLIVKNTNYYQDRLGLRIGLYHITTDADNNERATLVSGDELAGAVFYIDGLGYAPSANGFIRLKMTDFVVSIDKQIEVDLTNAEHLTSGLYEFRVTAFASADGLYAKQGDSVTNSMDTFRVYLVNEHYGLLATIDDDKDVIVYSDGKTAAGNDTIETTINYFGSYQNPNIKISMMRRDYSSVESYTYNDVNINNYFDISSTTFSDTSQLDRTDLFDVTTMTINKDALVDHISSGDMGVYRLTLKLKPGVDLPTGTYRIMYNLYNGDKPVGDVYTYIIIKD